jgi:hypothetical protein
MDDPLSGIGVRSKTLLHRTRTVAGQANNDGGGNIVIQVDPAECMITPREQLL